MYRNIKEELIKKKNQKKKTLIEELAGSIHAPMNKTMFGCFRLDQIESSRENSSII